MKEYISPITIFQTELNTELENNVYHAVMKYDIAVDKEELIKALKYDRKQYEKGFQDGVNSVITEVENIKDLMEIGFNKIIRR